MYLSKLPTDNDRRQHSNINAAPHRSRVHEPRFHIIFSALISHHILSHHTSSHAYAANHRPSTPQHTKRRPQSAYSKHPAPKPLAFPFPSATHKITSLTSPTLLCRSVPTRFKKLQSQPKQVSFLREESWVSRIAKKTSRPIPGSSLQGLIM